MPFVQEYTQSLKYPGAEEIVDLAIYRPAGFVFVKCIYKFPVTPNQVSFLSMIVGLFAGWQFAIGSNGRLILGGLLLAVSIVLDCADGQIARLKNNGTALGRIIDGVADYVVGVAVFIGIGIGLSRFANELWTVVILTGVSSALHAILFDRYQSVFISIIKGETNSLIQEIEKFSSQLHAMKRERKFSPKIILTTIYLNYLSLQQKSEIKVENIRHDAESYRKEHARMIRLWSFLGPSTNRTLLILCAFLGRIDWFCWGVLVVGNCWLAVCIFLQKRVHKKSLVH